MSGTANTIRAVLADVEPLMRAAFDAVNGTPVPGSSLDQVYLVDGREVVLDYLEHGEFGLAFDHLVYMIEEPPLTVSAKTFRSLVDLGVHLGHPPGRFDGIVVRA